MRTAINAQTGEIGIDLFSSSPIQTTASGSMVLISLHVRETAPVGSTGLQLVTQVNPTGQRAFVTTMGDSQGAFILHDAAASDQWAVDSGELGATVLSQPLADSNPAFGEKQHPTQLSPLPPAHSPLPTADLMEQVFAEIAPMLAQASIFGEPGTMVTSQSDDQTIVATQAKVWLEPLAALHGDVMAAALVQPGAEQQHAELSGLDDADLSQQVPPEPV